MKLVIPKYIDLPFGVTIRVEQKRFRGKDAPYARWRYGCNTIELNLKRPLAMRRADLIHELQHAFVDYMSEMQMTKGIDFRS